VIDIIVDLEGFIRGSFSGFDEFVDRANFMAPMKRESSRLIGLSLFFEPIQGSWIDPQDF